MDIPSLKIQHGITCELCYQDKVILVDRTKELVSVKTKEETSGKVDRFCYPTYRHPKYCYWHLKVHEKQL